MWNLATLSIGSALDMYIDGIIVMAGAPEIHTSEDRKIDEVAVLAQAHEL